MNSKLSPLARLSSLMQQYGGYAAGLFLFAVYFSTAAATILSILVGILWLGSGQFLQLPRLIKSQPVALWALLLYGVFIGGAAYSPASGEAIRSMLGKYRELFYIPILMGLFGMVSGRAWGWMMFTVASVVTLGISYLQFFGALPLNQFGDPALKSHITHSLFIALYGFFCMHKMLEPGRFARWYGVLFIICVHNQFFAVAGRTGQAVFLVLILLFMLQRFKLKQLLSGSLLMALFMAAYLNFSENSQRLNEGISDTQSYLQEDSSRDMTHSAMGQRYIFWQNSLKLLAEKPGAGHGTGSFSQEYQRIAKGQRLLTDNPHNEFLMITVQLGLPGLLAYLGFLGSQYYAARRLPEQDKFLAQGVLLALIVSSLFNTPIMDSTEGHWFAALIALCFAPAVSNSELQHD